MGKGTRTCTTGTVLVGVVMTHKRPEVEMAVAVEVDTGVMVVAYSA